jgi:hypothetical protein
VRPTIGRDVPEAERTSERSVLGSDLCKIKDRDYFVLGVVEMPVICTEDFFC